jgi:hypothetical protein
MWTNWDFDAQTIFPLLEHKLKRILLCLENGHAHQEPKDLKALKLAIKLAKRVSEDYHESKYYDWHEARWGELKTWFTPVEGKKGYSQWNSTRAKIVTEQDKAQEREAHIGMWPKIEKWRRRDERLLFAIIQNYYRNWWD